LLIIHAAWPVHFGAGLGSFVSHLEGGLLVIPIVECRSELNPSLLCCPPAGLRHLIDLAAMSPTSRIFFCSSTASVLGTGKRHVPERLSAKADDAVAMGYARSKHVAETICNAAWQSSMRGRIGVLRLGQLCGDTKDGIWKAEEGWPLLIGSVGCVGCLPDLAEVREPLNCTRAKLTKHHADTLVAAARPSRPSDL
jgi:thioester reductase-like protein